MDTNNGSNGTCGGSNYTYIFDYEKRTSYVDWSWFRCNETKRCIHQDSRCDLRPHPDCVYENDDVAEDEVGCFEEYKRKGLVPRSANYVCQSQDHNINSSAIYGPFWSGTSRSVNNTALLLRSGIIVQTLATRCDGLEECFNGEDEKGCGFDTLQVAWIGEYYFLAHFNNS